MADLETQVETNTTAIEANVVDLITNSVASTTNATNIQTNATNIQTNADDIQILQEGRPFSYVKILTELPVEEYFFKNLDNLTNSEFMLNGVEYDIPNVQSRGKFRILEAGDYRIELNLYAKYPFFYQEDTPIFINDAEQFRFGIVNDASLPQFMRFDMIRTFTANELMYFSSYNLVVMPGTTLYITKVG